MELGIIGNNMDIVHIEMTKHREKIKFTSQKSKEAILKADRAKQEVK